MLSSRTERYLHLVLLRLFAYRGDLERLEKDRQAVQHPVLSHRAISSFSEPAVRDRVLPWHTDHIKPMNLISS